MRIAIFDYLITRTNPTGGCNLRILEGLADEHDFTVFASRFDNPAPGRIRHVRVPVPRRPLALLFLVFHVIAPIAYLLERLRSGRFDAVQIIEGNTLFGRLCYAHFCHAAFLDTQWSRQRGLTGLRRLLRWVDHRVRVLGERRALLRATRVVVPSEGLRGDLLGYYPWVEPERITVVPNAVDLDRLEPPPAAERAAWRAAQGLAPDDVVLVFVGLGQWERKGLAPLLEALRDVAEPHLKLLVVGGERDVVPVWRTRAARLGLAGRVGFVGKQQDIRPFLWGAEAFILPSTYEVFSLATLEAAGAGLPVLVPNTPGMGGILEEGVTGLAVDSTPGGIAAALKGLLDMDPHERRRMGERAHAATGALSSDAFVDRWREVYRELEAR